MIERYVSSSVGRHYQFAAQPAAGRARGADAPGTRVRQCTARPAGNATRR
jgi:hypothetical protein